MKRTTEAYAEVEELCIFFCRDGNQTQSHKHIRQGLLQRVPSPAWRQKMVDSYCQVKEAHLRRLHGSTSGIWHHRKGNDNKKIKRWAVARVQGGDDSSWVIGILQASGTTILYNADVYFVNIIKLYKEWTWAGKMTYQAGKCTCHQVQWPEFYPESYRGRRKTAPENYTLMSTCLQGCTCSYWHKCTCTQRADKYFFINCGHWLTEVYQY